MFWIVVLSIIFLGLVFILAEILFVPGGLLGVVGLIILLFGIYYAYDNGGVFKGNVVLIGVGIVTLGLLAYLIRSRTWDKIALKSQVKEKYNVNARMDVKEGDQGYSVTRLNPMGKARFGEKYYEVGTRSGFIEQNKKIEVVKIEGSKIYVQEKTKNT